jgi:hypothetical protein
MTTPEELRDFADFVTCDVVRKTDTGAITRVLREYATLLEASASVPVPEFSEVIGTYKGVTYRLPSKEQFDAYGKAQFAAGVAAGRGMTADLGNAGDSARQDAAKAHGVALFSNFKALEGEYSALRRALTSVWCDALVHGFQMAKRPPAPQTPQQGEVE